jgi:hypothetical protein
MTAAEAMALIGYLAAGVAGGTLYFALLRRNVDLYVGGGERWRALALHVGRLAVAGGLFWVAVVTGGALPTVAALGGFVLARPLSVRLGKNRPSP